VGFVATVDEYAPWNLHVNPQILTHLAPDPISQVVPYMTTPGNHEASCAEFDGPGNILTAYLNNNVTNGTAPTSALNYYSCPPSQRNFTAYSNRFTMPVTKPDRKWYSFENGLAHIIMYDAETDYVNATEKPFLRDLSAADIAAGATLPTESETGVTNAGPFGNIDGGLSGLYNVAAYEQYQWLSADLAAVNRTKTPWYD
jgi:hypothetical protein